MQNIPAHQPFNDPIYLIDTIGPFFGKPKDRSVNWSKVPFQSLEKGDGLKPKRVQLIESQFIKYIQTVSEMGYNAITLDDLAHMVVLDGYPETLKQKLEQYRRLYRHLIGFAREKNLKVYVNTDLMYFNDYLIKQTRFKQNRIIAMLKQSLHILFSDYEVDGVIMRIGETDGVDVEGDFLSRLVIKTPRQANAYIGNLLPVFEAFKKVLIFRTWTVGIYPIGDLIWNKTTFDKTFRGIVSDHFMISMKYGDTDFFDMLPLNPLFFHGPWKRIIELQTRREREGFGTFPYYVGQQYASYYQQLKNNPRLAGISVWCQTGGWTRWTNLTFLRNSSVWNELNTFAAIRIFRDHQTAKTILHDFFRNRSPLMAEYVDLCTRLFREVLYIQSCVETPCYFRRLRIPPLLWFYWDHVTINPFLVIFLEFSGHTQYKPDKKAMRRLRKLGKTLALPDAEPVFRTLQILGACRKALYRKKFGRKLLSRIDSYLTKADQPPVFSIHSTCHHHHSVRLLLRLLVRTGPSYRAIDYFLLSAPVSFLMRAAIRLSRKNLPKFVNQQAMKIDLLFR